MAYFQSIPAIRKSNIEGISQVLYNPNKLAYKINHIIKLNITVYRNPDFYYQITQMQQNTNYCKADISFSNAYTNLRDSYRKHIVFHLLFTIIFTIFLPIDCLTLPTGDKMPVALGVALAVCVTTFAILVYWSIKIFKGNNYRYCLLAQKCSHATDQPVVQYSSIQSCTSDIIFLNSKKLHQNDLSKEVMKEYSIISQQQLQNYLAVEFFELTNWLKTYDLITLVGVGMVISLLLVTKGQNVFEIYLLFLYIYLQLYLRRYLLLRSLMTLLMVSGIIVVTPFALIGLPFYLCCCKKGVAKLDLKAAEATLDQVTQANGQCAICLMKIKEKDMIYELPCSKKHVFHEGCLNKWVMIKMNCPSCRTELPKKEIAEAESAVATN